MDEEIKKLFDESTDKKNDCNLCKESGFAVGKSTGYGIVVCRIGSKKNGWFATLSPKTGGNPKTDFTIQLMPFIHLTHFSQINDELAKNYGILFGKVCQAMAIVSMQNENLKSQAEKKEESMPLATYGKCTTWKEKKEHLHIKVFHFRNNIGQPSTVDSSFEKKQVFRQNGKEFVKMEPVKKVTIDKSRFEKLAKELISLLK